MFWHIDTDIVGFIVLSALYVYYLRMLPREEYTERNRRFVRCLLIGIIVTSVDIAASVVMDMTTNVVVYHLFMMLYLVSIELIIVEWLIYALHIIYPVGDRHIRRISVAAWSLYGAYNLLVLSNPWSGLFFTYNAVDGYTRGPWFMSMVVVYALYALAIIVLVMIRWNKITDNYPKPVLLMSPFVFSIAIVVQLMMPGWLMIMPTYMICMVLAFLFFQTVRFKTDQQLVQSLSKAAITDQLTGLYNRTGLEAMVQHTLADEFGKGVLVIMVDIDDLKHINDTLGHADGDLTIKTVAKQLKNHFRSSDIVARFGGDEFVIYLTGDLNEAQSHISLRRLSEELSSLCIGTDIDLPLNCSVGAVFGIVGDDSFESLCAKADSALYHVKRNGKNGYSFYRPEMDTEMLSVDRADSKTRGVI